MCKDDSITYIRLVERGKIFKFLHGLNFKYNLIWVQVLGKEKLPYLSEVPQKDQPPKENPAQKVVVGNTASTANYQDIPMIQSKVLLQQLIHSKHLHQYTKDENWVQAMNKEMKALEKKSTWEIVGRPKDKRVIDIHCKCKFDRTLDRYKARLVVKEYTQTYKLDYRLQGDICPYSKDEYSRNYSLLSRPF
ncbi:putative mitochondrial protein, partial [Mucuna pruriens]